MLEAGQLEAELTPATRLFCTSWVFSFTGHMIDLAAVGRVCRRAGVTFVVNGSQAVGAVPLDLADLPVDALVSCGFKWLCGLWDRVLLAPPRPGGLAHLPAGLLAVPPGPGGPRPGHRLPAPRPGRRRPLGCVRRPALLTFGRGRPSVDTCSALASSGSRPGTSSWSSGSSTVSTRTATGWSAPGRAAAVGPGRLRRPPARAQPAAVRAAGHRRGRHGLPARPAAGVAAPVQQRGRRRPGPRGPRRRLADLPRTLKEVPWPCGR